MCHGLRRGGRHSHLEWRRAPWWTVLSIRGARRNPLGAGVGKSLAGLDPNAPSREEAGVEGGGRWPSPDPARGAGPGAGGILSEYSAWSSPGDSGVQGGQSPPHLGGPLAGQCRPAQTGSPGTLLTSVTAAGSHFGSMVHPSDLPPWREDIMELLAVSLTLGGSVSPGDECRRAESRGEPTDGGEPTDAESAQTWPGQGTLRRNAALIFLGICRHLEGDLGFQMGLV